jgi:hypothetical protein
MVMQDANTACYYREREAVQKRLADRAQDPVVRAIHRRMANQYRALVEEDGPVRRS